MGGSQSAQSSTATVTRGTSDQVGVAGGGREVSLRKSGNVPSSRHQSQPDPSLQWIFVGDDDGGTRRGGREKEGRGNGESDDSPSAQHHSLSQPAPPPPASHSHHHHTPHTTNSHSSRTSHNNQQQQQQRSHHHRQRHNRPPSSLPPIDLELSVPILNSRSQPSNPSSNSLHTDLELALPTRPSTRRRQYYEPSQPTDMDFDLSGMASLSQRLRAVGLFTEESGSGSSSSRRHHRPRRHHTHSSSHQGSRSRHLLSSSGAPSSVVLVRGLSARMTCPLCSKEFTPTDLEEHLLTCMTKPRVRYNVDTLQQESGECSICLEDMGSGDQIARLPCLCIYHIKCLQQWYKVNPTCPEHPDSTL